MNFVCKHEKYCSKYLDPTFSKAQCDDLIVAWIYLQELNISQCYEQRKLLVVNFDFANELVAWTYVEIMRYFTFEIQQS
jgi:hypothetical protein